MTGCSRARAPRLTKTYTATGSLKRQQRTTNGFTQRYTQANKRLLAEADQLHNDLNGCGIKKICERVLSELIQYIRVTRMGLRGFTTSMLLIMKELDAGKGRRAESVDALMNELTDGKLSDV